MADGLVGDARGWVHSIIGCDEMIDIRDNPEVLEAINAVLNNSGIAEVKQERDGLTVVEIKRTLKTQKKKHCK